MLKYANLKTAFKTDNSKKYYLRLSTKKNYITINANYLPSCMYELTYPGLLQGMYWPNWQGYNKRFKEHHLSFRNYSTSKFAQNLLEYRHSFSKMKNIKQILHFNKKDTHVNTTGKIYIYKDTTKFINYMTNISVQPIDIFEAITEDEGRTTYVHPPLLPRLETTCM
jgi:hypothetical protein